MEFFVEDGPLEGEAAVVESEEPLLFDFVLEELDSDCVLLDCDGGGEDGELLFDDYIALFGEGGESLGGFEVLGVEEGEVVILDDEDALVVEESCFALLEGADVVVGGVVFGVGLHEYVLE